MRPTCRFPRLVASFALALLSAHALHAAAYTVDSIAALQTRLESAAPGDTITVKNGAYTTSAPLTVACAGEAGKPITIAAESISGVEIRGTHGFNVTKPAAHVIIRGFKFTHASGKIAIGGGTHHVRFSRNTFQCAGEGPYLGVSGDDAEVDYNEFRDKSTLGNMISVTGTGKDASAQVARRLWIHHNYFHDFANARGNGAETIRFGLSGYSMSRGEGLVEHNLFVRCVGENELISNKSCANTYRFNTLLDSKGAQLTIRHGNDCVVYGNYFRGTDGLRIFGDRHLVHSNYFEGNSMGINLGNGGAEVADGAPLTSHDRPDNCVIVFNTLVNNDAHYRMTERKPTALGATNTTFAHNIMTGGGLAAQIEGPNPGATWSGNLTWKTKGPGVLPAGSFTEADPKLAAADANGAIRLQFPGANGFKFNRDAKLAPHAGEPGAPITVRILTEKDVGPLAK